MVTSISDWVDEVRKLRKTTTAIINSCYINIDGYMDQDIRKEDYQTGSPSNLAAVTSLKNHLDKKYNWLSWIVYSYRAYGNDNHVFQRFTKAQFHYFPNDLLGIRFLAIFAHLYLKMVS